MNFLNSGNDVAAVTHQGLLLAGFIKYHVTVSTNILLEPITI